MLLVSFLVSRTGFIGGVEEASLNFRKNWVTLAMTFDRPRDLGVSLSPSLKWVGIVLRHSGSCSDCKDPCGIKKKKSSANHSEPHRDAISKLAQ